MTFLWAVLCGLSRGRGATLQSGDYATVRSERPLTVADANSVTVRRYVAWAGSLLLTGRRRGDEITRAGCSPPWRRSPQRRPRLFLAPPPWPRRPGRRTSSRRRLPLSPGPAPHSSGLRRPTGHRSAWPRRSRLTSSRTGTPVRPPPGPRTRTRASRRCFPAACRRIHPSLTPPPSSTGPPPWRPASSRKCRSP